MRRRVRTLLGLFVVLFGLALSLPSGAEEEANHGPARPVAASVAPSTSAHPSASASAPAQAVEAIVRLKDRKVFSLSVEREGRSALDRAREATQALERAFDAHEGDAHFERKGDTAIVFVGKTPIVELDQEDAAEAGKSLDTYAADVTAKVNSAIAGEKKRSAIANSVFSFSLVVFAGLIAFLLLGKASEIGSRSREWVEDNPDRIPSLRLGGIELLRPASIEALLTIAIDVAKRIVQFGVLYAWIIFSLSLFESTKGYTDKLTTLVLGPLASFFARIGTGLPLAIVTLIAVLATFLLVRFTGVFFAGVARGETTLDWVPQDLAAPVGIIVRIGIIVVALVLASPLLTGSEDGALSRAGIATLIAFGLAATPLLACGVVGMTVVFNRKLRPGEFVEIAGRTGRVRHVSLLEVTVEDESGCEVRIPHLVALWNTTRVMGPAPVVSVELVVDPTASQVRVRDVLAEAAQKVGSTPRIELASIDADGALYRVSVGMGPQLMGPIVVPTGRRTRSSPGNKGSIPPGASPRTRSSPGKGSIPPAPAVPRIITFGGTGGVQPAGALGVATTVQLTSLLADALAKEGIALGRRSFASFHAAQVRP